MRISPRTNPIRIITLIALVLCISPRAEAKLVFSFGVEGSYHDNVIGLVQDNPNLGGTTGGTGYMGGSGGMSILPAPQNGLNNNPGGTGSGTGMGTGGDQNVQQGDFSATLSADIGRKTSWGDKTDVLLLAAVSHTAFATYDEFNFTVGSVSAGMTRYLTDVLSARFSVKAAEKKFENPLRDSSAFGASAGLKETVNDNLWFKQAYEFEKNHADSPLYTYQGHSATAWIGLSLSEDTSLDLGYGCLVRSYDLPEGFKVTTQNISVSLTADLSDSWSCSLGYDHEMADSNVPGTTTTNNISSIGLRYNY